jgi:hypothetical protein
MYEGGIQDQLAGLFNEVTKTSVNSVNMGFFLAAALAWNEVVKRVIREAYGPKDNGLVGFLAYAGILTLVATLVFSLTKRYLNAEQRVPVNWAVLGK